MDEKKTKIDESGSALTFQFLGGEKRKKLGGRDPFYIQKKK